MKKKSEKARIKKKDQTDETLEASAVSFPVVGIGASAGGVEASSEFLKHLKANLGMAFIFVHHLGSESHLTEILQRHTSMPVREVADGITIEPNHVYVIPVKMYLRIQDRHLKLEPREAKAATGAIDYFFSSLATHYQSNAVGVLLSGTAHDGTLGLKEIKEKGGITFAQNETAMHQQMPSSAQDAGYVDYVLSPKQITEELAALTQHPYSITLPNEELARNERQIKKILTIILDRYGVDFFSHYKRTTIYRRIIRRMRLNKVRDFDEYARKLREDSDETYLLYQDFLINVTSFFREPEFYEALTKVVFPQIIRNRQGTEPLGIWISGCATGEEAYSTGICISEYLERKKIAIPVQLFSTDLDEKAIEKARLGLYNKNAVQDISPQRLKKYFHKVDGRYQIAKPIRDMCIFSVHNLLKDPPFSRMDLISCQNVLIYIEAAPQRRILQSFHYALKPTGFLLLGKSESIANAVELFQPIEGEAKLFVKKNQYVVPRLDLVETNRIEVSRQTSTETSESRTESDVEREFDKILLARYVPASVLVNKDLEIMRFRGPTSRYFEPASGKASLNLLKMVKEDLIFELRSMLQKAKKTETVVSKTDIALGDGEVTIQISPLRSSKDRYYLIVFNEQADTLRATDDTKPSRSQQQSRILKLEQALREAREHIRTISEDFDVGREELQSANEEILSANEELQSINEELETSKEELQSSNEELTTINEELQNRLVELKDAKEYIEAIIDTMHSPLLVLSSQFRVRTANKAFYNFFQLHQEETEGRFMNNLDHGLWEVPALRSQLTEMLPKRIQFKDFEIIHEFPRIGKRIMMVNAHRLGQTEHEGENLLLIAFQDITAYREAAEELMRTQQQLNLALEGGKVGTWIWDLKSDVTTGSKEEARLFGLNDNAFFKTFKEWENSVHPQDVERVKRAIQQSIKNQRPLETEFRILWPDGSVHWILSKANPYYDEDGSPSQMMGVNIDITETKRAVEILEESERRFHHMSDHAPVMIWMTDADQRCTFVNRAWLLFTGKSTEEELGTGWQSSIHPEDLQQFLQTFRTAHAQRIEFKIDYRARRHDAAYRWLTCHGVPRFAGQNELEGFIGSCIDISERIDLERQKDDFMSIASHELKTPVTSIKAYTQILQQKFTGLNDESSAKMLMRLDAQIDKLTALINTLLDVSRIQSGQMEYNEDNLNVVELLNEVVAEMQPTSTTHKIIVDSQAKGTAVGDKAKLAQVLTNLISNAIKYSPEADKVLISVHEQDRRIVVSVQDFGVGIPADLQERIFGRFFRVSEASGNRVSGLGLGLFISAQIVKQQGGDIWVESEPGKGSKFSIAIPKAT